MSFINLSLSCICKGLLLTCKGKSNRTFNNYIVSLMLNYLCDQTVFDIQVFIAGKYRVKFMVHTRLESNQTICIKRACP